MIATWMLYGTVVATLVGVGALALERGARLLGRAGRWCWVGAMALTLALPAVAWFQPQVLPPVIMIPTPNGGALEARPPVRITAPAISYRAAPPFNWSDLNRPLAYGWGLLSLGLLVWFGMGTWQLRRMRRSWRSEGDVLVSENVGPAVVGFLRCRVVVPEWSLALGAEQRELLLAHEAEHLAAYDSRLLLLSAAVLALVPWNPGLWWQFRRLRLAIELDCDRRVLRRRPDPATYGRLLLEVGARAARSLIPVAAFHEPISSLETRIRTMTARKYKRAGLWAALMVAGAGVATFIACEAPRPTGAAEQEGFTLQTKQEDGWISSTFIADSVRHYFPEIAQHWSNQPVYLWFILSSDHRVVSYGTTPRAPGEDTIRSTGVASVVPGFDMPRFYRVTTVGLNAMGPGSPPVYWAELRDPSKPLSHLPPEVDSLALLPWVREGLQKWWAPLLDLKSDDPGEPVEVWFVADMRHRVLMTYASPPSIKSGPDIGTLVRRHFPGIEDSMIYGFSTGGTHHWTRSNVQIVWVTLRDGRATEQWFQSLRVTPTRMQ